jgi:hypothetical protein
MEELIGAADTDTTVVRLPAPMTAPPHPGVAPSPRLERR